MKNISKIIFFSLIASSSLWSASTKNIDNGANITLTNQAGNILNFPFSIEDAKLVTQNPDNFEVKPSNNSLIIVPKSAAKEKGDLIVISKSQNTYLIEFTVEGKEKIWNFTSNKIKEEVTSTNEGFEFESGVIDNDIKSLIKSVQLDEKIPGYKKISIDKTFDTEDLTMNKSIIWDGGTYRVEEWILTNKKNETLLLIESDFYTKGILSVAIDNPKLEPYASTKQWLIVNKASLVEDKNK